ncbi:hypothetical protein GCM10009665_28800 [Kitasatospora nipponensis]|uniref:DUF11 domain-containing protein n=1 Tax=Kitasatospora nipponensis TaxID=258049 RepID=A0ABN1W901_9ACTN
MRLPIVPLLTAALLAAVPAPAAWGATGADLQVVPLDPDPAPGIGRTTVLAFVANGGPGPAGAFVVTVLLPPGARAVGPYFPAGCAVLAAGSEVRCSFGAGLPALRSATALVPVQLAASARGRLRGEVLVTGAGDPNPANNTGSFTIEVTGTR